MVCIVVIIHTVCIYTTRVFSGLQALSAKVAEKHGITSRLTELIMASEKQRDSKLNEIMKKMSTDGAGEGGGGGGLTRGASR